MRRKIIPQGMNALTITLPKKWANNLNLGPGDDVIIDEKGKTLTLSVDRDTAPKRIQIDISDFEDNEIIWRMFSSFYRMGYDEIEVRFKDISKKFNIVHSTLSSLENKVRMRTLEMLQDCLQRFIGLEIIEHNQNKVLIKSMSSVLPNEFDSALRRTFNLLINASEESLKSLGSSKSRLEDMEVNDRNIDRLVDFCLRILNKKGHPEYSKTSVYYSIILLLESLGDEFKLIGRIAEKAETVSDKTIELHKSINSLLKSFYEFFYKFSIKKSEIIYNDIRKLITKINQTEAKNSERKIVERINRIVSLVSELTQLKLDMEI